MFSSTLTPVAQIKLLEREMDGSKLLVFCETKRGCDTVTRQLRQDGWPALAIHGDKSQQERDWVLAVSLLGALLLRAQESARSGTLKRASPYISDALTGHNRYGSMLSELQKASRLYAFCRLCMGLSIHAQEACRAETSRRMS